MSSRITKNLSLPAEELTKERVIEMFTDGIEKFHSGEKFLTCIIIIESAEIRPKRGLGIIVGDDPLGAMAGISEKILEAELEKTAEQMIQTKWDSIPRPSNN